MLSEEQKKAIIDRAFKRYESMAEDAILQRLVTDNRERFDNYVQAAAGQLQSEIKKLMPI